MGNSEAKALKPPVTLTSSDKNLLVTTWRSHVHTDEFIGGKVFDQMFSDAPEMKDGFSHFAEIDVHDEHYNDVLHRHGSRVKGAVGRVIESLNEQSEMKSYLTKLGCRHFKEYDFNPEYIKVILNYFLMAIKEAMGSEWNTEVEDAYTKLFELITFHMINSLLSKRNPLSGAHDDGLD